MKMAKRVLAVFLAAVLAFGTLAAAAFAADEPEVTVEPEAAAEPEATVEPEVTEEPEVETAAETLTVT